MLKPPIDPTPRPEDDDRPVGELLNRLVEDGKAYARAEMGVARATVEDWLDALKLPAILFGTALVLVLASITALAYGVAAGLATLIGPLAGGFVAFLLFACLAGVLAWYGVARIRERL